MTKNEAFFPLWSFENCDKTMQNLDQYIHIALKAKLKYYNKYIINAFMMRSSPIIEYIFDSFLFSKSSVNK